MRVDSKTKRKLTETQKKMSKVCIDIVGHCAKSVSFLIFSKKSYEKLLENENVKNDEKIVAEINEMISIIKQEINDINEAVKEVSETMNSLTVKKKDKIVVGKVKTLLSSEKITKIDLENMEKNLSGIIDNINSIKKDFNIEDKKKESDGEFVEEKTEEPSSSDEDNLSEEAVTNESEDGE